MGLKSKFIIWAFIIICGYVFAVSCGNAKSSRNVKELYGDTANAERKVDTVELVTSLEELFSYVPQYTVFKTCDLSHLGLKKIPFLRQYDIKRLDLSNNELRRFEYFYFLLPPSVEELILDSCNMGNIRWKDFDKKNSLASSHLYDTDLYLEIKENYFPKLKKIDVSYNKIKAVTAPANVEVVKTHFNDCKGFVNHVRTLAYTNGKTKRDTVRLVKSLDELFKLAPNTVVLMCDLSNQGLKKIPHLRNYNIKRLDISGNDFSRYGPFKVENIAWFPTSVEELYINDCRLGEAERIGENKNKDYPVTGTDMYVTDVKLPCLRKIDLSGNYIDELLVSAPVKHLDVSRNGLKRISIRTNTVEYLDVSYNWHMKPYLNVPPQSIDTLKADSCAHGRLLENTWWRIVGE